MEPHRPKRTFLRLLWLTLYTACLYLYIKIAGKLKA